MFLAFVLLLAMVGTAQATVAAKQTKVNYRDIKITSDGKAISVLPAEEPFILNGTTYVPLRVVAEAINSYVAWQAQTSTVAITSKTSSEVATLKQQLTQKDQQIALLQKQIDDLKAQKSSSDDLNDLEEELLDDYDTLEDVDIEDITLNGDEDQVDVEIEVDLGDYEDEWADLSDSDIKGYIEDIVDDIQYELSDDTEVDGEIIDIDSDDVLVEFTKDGTSSLKVYYKDDDYRDGGSADDAADVIDDLKGDTYSVDDIDFTVANIRYYEASDKITVYMDAEDSDASEQWSTLTRSTKESEVESICEDLVDEFDSADVNLETVLIYFYDEDSSLLDSYSYDVDDQALD